MSRVSPDVQAGAVTSWANPIESFGLTGMKHLRASLGALLNEVDEHVSNAVVASGDWTKTSPTAQKHAPAQKQLVVQKQTNVDSPDDGSQKEQKPTKKEGDVPAGRKQMYFRPVSVTLQCVMVLTIVSLLVYTFLSISRNSDELSATFTPSTGTQTLTIGARVASFSPMMCMLFVGCRMYVLATTEGLGEPPAWVKQCMWLSVGGFGLQLLTVVLLPVFTKKQAEEEASYDMTEGKAKEVKAKKETHDKKVAEVALKKKVRMEEDAQALGEEGAVSAEDGEEEPAPLIHEETGEQNDVHPALGSLQYEKGKDYMKVPFWIMQILSMVCLYGGLAGVIYGIITFPAQTTKMSVAVMCTVALSALYFTVCLLLWIGRTIAESLTHAALAMSSVVRKAPMFAVLFLASRMRALQLDPPYGIPPFWMQCCFYGITAFVFLETLIAAVIGATGEMKKAYYGVYLFECKSKALNAAQHSCAICTYLFLFPIVHGVYAMTFADGSEAPLSTTLKCVVVFEGVYFAVMFAQSLVLFAEEVKGTELSMMRDATVAAGISLGLAPLLCILFVATRMRALQITQQLGAPPGWAQDCMLIAVFATCVQAFCCLLMPIFVGSACKVDDDGNPDYDLEPMVGAYAVAVVKYVALIALHASVITVCISVYAMTPESAHDGGRFITSKKELFKGLAITFGIFCVALLFSSAKVVGMAIKFAIESCDSTLLGTEITVEKVALNLFKGYVHIKKLKVHNPEDEIVWTKDASGKLTSKETGKKCDWRDDYIAKIHLILVKINLWRIIKSLTGRIEFELENLSIVGIHVNIEKPNTDLKATNSNVEYIVNHLDAMGLIPPPEAAETPSSPKKEPVKKQEPAKTEIKKIDAKPLDFPKIVLHKIAIMDIGASVTIKGVRGIGQLHFEPTVGGFEIKDIQAEIFGGREDLTPGETVACLVKAIAQRIFTSVAKEIPKQVAKAAGDAAKNVLGNVHHHAKNVAGGVARKASGILRKLSGHFDVDDFEKDD